MISYYDEVLYKMISNDDAKVMFKEFVDRLSDEHKRDIFYYII